MPAYDKYHKVANRWFGKGIGKKKCSREGNPG